jgi:pyruvate, orthophosphate dikinase
VERAFFSRYVERGTFEVPPFQTIDTEGVGRLI